MPRLHVSHTEFEADLRLFARLLDIDIALATRRVALQAFVGIVQKTPVDTGRARSNWGINVGAPAPPPSNAITEEESARRNREQEEIAGESVTAKAVSAAEASSAGIDGKDIVHITNNLPYVPLLNQGTSKQAPAGFVEATLVEISREIIETTSRI